MTKKGTQPQSLEAMYKQIDPVTRIISLANDAALLSSNRDAAISLDEMVVLLMNVEAEVFVKGFSKYEAHHPKELQSLIQNFKSVVRCLANIENSMEKENFSAIK